ncbi:CiaD-like domain-containing protein [Sulfurimonas sp.]
MELKDVILSTLAEMEENITPEAVNSVKDFKPQTKAVVEKVESDELYFLNSIRERLLVLFEGFQAPNNANIEAKVDMTLNFLEYTLATIDARVEKLEKGTHK